MTTQKGFGKFLNLEGKLGVFPSTAVPIDLLQNLKSNAAIPTTTTATTFVINASVTDPVHLWNGNDFFTLKETLTYTFTNGTNTVFLNSAGVTAAAQVTAAVCYYFYVGQTTAGAQQLYPSSVAPSYVEGPYEGGKWCHPGTTRDRYWNYVGFGQNTATTPAFALLVKRGFTYNNPTPTAMAVVDNTGVSTGAVPVDLSTMVPIHGAELSGYITQTTAAALGATWDIGSNSLAAGSFRTVQTTITYPAIASFTGLIPDSSGYLWAKQSASIAAGGDVSVTQVKDVV